MAQHNWQEYQTIVNNNDMETINKCFNALNAILKGDSISDECVVFRSVLKRITIRLRSARVSRHLRHTKKCLSQAMDIKLLDEMNNTIETLVEEKYDTTSGCILLPFKQQIESLLQLFVNSLQIYRKFIIVSMNAFGHCIPWLRSGNLTPHFLMMTAALSRLNVLYKAIIVYMTDIYRPLNSLKKYLKIKKLNYNIEYILPETLDSYLTGLGIKCVKNARKVEPIVNIQASNEVKSSEDIGVVIKRTEDNDDNDNQTIHQTYETVELKINKKKLKKKSKNKNKLTIKSNQRNKTIQEKEIQIKKMKKKFKRKNN